MDDKSNYFSLSSLSPAHNRKYPSHIGSRAKSLNPPRQEASYHAAKLKTAIAYDAQEEERFAFTTEAITKAGQHVLLNTLNRKQLSSQDRRNDFSMRALSAALLTLKSFLLLPNREKDHSVNI